MNRDTWPAKKNRLAEVLKEKTRQEWCDLMRLGMGPDGFDPDLRATSQKF